MYQTQPLNEGSHRDSDIECDADIHGEYARPVDEEPVEAPIEHVHFGGGVRDTDTEIAHVTDESDSGNGSQKHEYFTLEPPDGGYGWVICACAFIHQMIADGILFSFGVLYIYLLEHFQSGQSETSWVGAVLMGTSMMSGPLAGAVVNKYSLRTAGFLGSLIAAAGLFASYFAPSILILTMTYGVVTGIGCGFIFLTSILACSMYFKKRRSLANGIAMCGSGVGVFVLSPVLVYFVEWYGWSGALLMLSGLALHGCVVSALYRPLEATRHTQTFIVPDEADSGIDPLEEEAEKIEDDDNICDVVDHHDEENQPIRSAARLGASSYSLTRSAYWDNVQNKQLSYLDIYQIGSMLTLPTVHSMKENGLTHSRSAMTLDEKQSYMFWRYNNYECSSALTACCRTFSCHLLKRPSMFLLVLAGMLWTGQSTTYTFIVEYATSIGISENYGALILSCIGITNCIGRVLTGVITNSPRVNSILVYVISIALAGVVNIFIPFINNYAVLLFMGTMFGLSMASYVSLRSIVVVDIIGIDHLAGALGLFVMFQGVAFTIVPPISGAILEATQTFRGPFIASGVCYLLSAVFMIPLLFRRCRPDIDDLDL